jgi:hypothetical protein
VMTPMAVRNRAAPKACHFRDGNVSQNFISSPFCAEPNYY